jgi:hypothetical protein
MGILFCHNCVHQKSRTPFKYNGLQFFLNYYMKRYAISLKQFTGWHFLLTEKMQPVRWVQKRKPAYPERITDHGQVTGKLYHLRLRVECTLFRNLQSRARTHTVLVICLYELLGNPTT